MYVKNTQLTAHFVLAPSASPPAQTAYDIILTDPDGVSTYTDNGLTAYVAPSATAQGSATYVFTPTAEGTWTLELAIGTGLAQTILAKGSLQAIVPVVYANSSTLARELNLGQQGIYLPVAPTVLIAIAFSSQQIDLTWVDNSDNETGFIIERSLTTGTGFVAVFTTAINAVAWSDTGLTGETEYFYRIKATAILGDSAYATEASATTLAVGDLDYNDVVLLMTSKYATQGQITFTDESIVGRTLSRGGQVLYDNTQSKHDVTSALFDGSGNDWVSMPDAADLGLEDRTVAFCLEAWIYVTADGDNNNIMGGRDATSSEEFTWGVTGIEPNMRMTMQWWATTWGLSSPTGSISLNTWHHVAVTRRLNGGNGDVELFIDGVSVATDTQVSNSATNTGVYYIGHNAFNSTRDFNGHIDSIRLTRNNARYPAGVTFTPGEFFSYIIKPYKVEALNDSPVGYWSFEETSGNFIDQGSSGTDLTLYGTAERGWETMSGGADFTDYSLYCPGGASGARNTSPNSALQLDQQDYTLEAWVYLQETPTATQHVITWGVTGETELTNYLYNMRINATTRFLELFFETTGFANHNVTSTYAVPINENVLLAIVHDLSAKEVTFYANGVLQDTQTYTGNGPVGGGSGDLWIGVSPSGDGLVGKVDEVAIYGTALTAARLLAHYNGVTPKVYGAYEAEVRSDNPVCLFPMREQSGTVTKDAIGSMHGAITGATLNNASMISDAGASGILFSGTTSGVLVLSQPVFQLIGDMTLEMWVDIKTWQTADSLLSVHVSGETSDTNLVVDLRTATTLETFTESGAGVNEILTSTETVVTGIQHLALVRDTTAKEYRFYKNGVLVDTVAYVRDVTDGSSGNFMIGRRVSGSYQHGAFEMVALYDTALATADILAHYNAA